MEKYRELKEAKIAADAHITDLESTVREQRKEIERLRLDNEALRLMRSLSGSEDDIKRNKAVVAQLVQEIDKCIRQLSD